MTIFWSRPEIVSRTPLVTVCLLEAGNIQQLWRMWHEHTAAGQSLGGWIAVGLALIFWCNFYRVCCPEQRFALWTTLVGVAMNAAVVLTVVYFRYIA